MGYEEDHDVNDEHDGARDGANPACKSADDDAKGHEDDDSRNGEEDGKRLVVSQLVAGVVLSVDEFEQHGYHFLRFQLCTARTIPRARAPVFPGGRNVPELWSVSFEKCFQNETPCLIMFEQGNGVREPLFHERAI